MPTARERELFTTWRELSHMVHRLRHTPVPTATNGVLRQHLDEAPDGLLAPAALLWMADNCSLEGQLRDAISLYEELATIFPDRWFGATAWAITAREQAAWCYQGLGHYDAGIATYRRLLEQYPEATSASWVQFRIGQLAEAAGRPDEAVDAYQRSAEAGDDPDDVQVAVPDLARRHGDRLASDRAWMHDDLATLARDLVAALVDRDTDRLARLASRTHFSLGFAGGERAFTDAGPLLDVLAGDLEISRVTGDPRRLGGSGGKRYLLTGGWEGSFVTGSAALLLTAAGTGWEWSGVVLMRRPDTDTGGWPGDPDLPPEDPPDLPEDPSGPEVPGGPPVTPETLRMKAPWPAGEHFRAGGVVGFAAQLAAFGGIADANLFTPLIWAVLLEGASLTTPCGFGPGGLYYGQPTTHVGRDTFAVDFSRFVRGVPLLLDAAGKPVLAVADGIVRTARSGISSGDPALDNRVVIGHMTEAELLLAVLIQLLTGEKVREKYTSEYLHLAGPGQVPVSQGMFLRQGARLGLVDDTGLSVADHLHFSLHDRDLPRHASSVRPTPMDGQTLHDGDDGRCLHSTNVPVP